MSMSLSGSGETGSGSVEVSVRTDLTVTSDGDSEDAHNNPSKRYAKEIYTLTADKTQLQQVVEKLRLELQGRDAQLLANKGRYETLLNQMSSSNGIKLSEKQAIINRLESNLRTGNEETRVLKERAANELAHLMEKCQQFQQKQERLKVKHDEVKATLNNIHISEAEFNRLKLLSEKELNLQQVVSVRLHEIVVPLQLKIKELESIKASLGSTLLFRERDLENVRQENIRLEHHVGQLSRKLIDSTKEYEDLRKDLKQDDYRIYNFDRIKQERDKYEKECEIVTKEKGELEWSSSVYKKEKEVLEDRLSELKTKLRNQELELSRSQMELQDVRKHFESGKENTTRTYSQLKSERERSENFQEKYLKARTELISLSESLTDCKNEIKLLNDKLMFVTKSEEDVKEKYENLLARYNDISQDLDMMQGKSLKEKDLYKQEINELKANFFTLSKNNTDLLNDNIKLQKEVKDSKDNQADRIKAIEREDSDLRREVSELKRQLDVYKTLEDDYLSTLRTFASVPLNLEEGDCRYTSGIPALSIVKGKLSEETISLTRRILTLERKNVEACTTIQKLTACLSQMRSSIASYKAALSMAGKPSAQLFERITSQEEQILALEIALKASNESKQGLSDQISKLKNDLKEALNHIKEAGDVKREIESIRKELNSLPTAFIDNKIYNNENSSRGRPPLNLPSAIKIIKLGSEKKV